MAALVATGRSVQIVSGGNMAGIKIREANLNDVGLIHRFVRELAIYEKAEHEMLATEDDIRKSIFIDKSTVEALICERNGSVIGFAVYFLNYSTWLGKNGLYLEDLYITPAERGKGAGKILLKHLAKLAVNMGCGRFEWNVLDWNEPSIKFYESLGAVAQSEWIGYRMSGKALIDFAK
jgi:GNAT superfamily N-acetyltransferase